MEDGNINHGLCGHNIACAYQAADSDTKERYLDILNNYLTGDSSPDPLDAGLIFAVGIDGHDPFSNERNRVTRQTKSSVTSAAEEVFAIIIARLGKWPNAESIVVSLAKRALDASYSIFTEAKNENKHIQEWPYMAHEFVLVESLRAYPEAALSVYELCRNDFNKESPAAALRILLTAIHNVKRVPTGLTLEVASIASRKANDSYTETEVERCLKICAGYCSDPELYVIQPYLPVQYFLDEVGKRYRKSQTKLLPAPALQQPKPA